MHNISLYTLCTLIWGSTWYAITFQLDTVHPILSVSYRFMLAAAALFVYAILTRSIRWRYLTRRHHFFIALQGAFFFCINYIFIYLGAQYLPSGFVAILFSTLTFFNIFNDSLFFKTSIRKQVMLGSIIGFAGIVTVFWPEISNVNLAGPVVKGTLLCLLSAYCASLGNIIAVRNARDGISVMESNTFGMAYGALFSFIFAVSINIEITFDPSLVYMGTLSYLAIIGTSVGFAAYITLTRNVGADRAGYIAVLAPVVALIISTFFENYIWTTNAACGVVLIIVGNILAMGRFSKLFKQNPTDNPRR